MESKSTVYLQAVGQFLALNYYTLFTFRKLCVGVKYYIVHMYSVPYYTYGSTANFLFLGPTALIYIYIKRTAL